VPQVPAKNAWPCATKTGRYRNVPWGNDNPTAALRPIYSGVAGRISEPVQMVGVTY
jgi:hypothetical protein